MKNMEMNLDCDILPPFWNVRFQPLAAYAAILWKIPNVQS